MLLFNITFNKYMQKYTQIEDNITYSKFGQGWEYTITDKNDHRVTLNGNVGDFKATSLNVSLC